MTTCAKFFAAHEPPRPVFITQRKLEVTSFYWRIGRDPYRRPKKIVLPKGTRIVYNDYSNMGNGHSMQLARNPKNRWFTVFYKDMELAPVR